MIPILYDSSEIAFTNNGLGRLRDCISCVVTEERNGIYECDFEYPLNGANYDKIQLGRIIATKHDDTNDIQPFDIVSCSKPINGIVTFHANHVSYRQSKLTVAGTNINSLADALTLLGTATPGNPFTYETDMVKTGYLAAANGIPRSVRQMLGGIEGSILDAYGGEYEWDGFVVRLLSARGVQRDLTIRYGVNMLEYNEDTDYSNTYTAVIPYWAAEEDIVVGSMVSSGQEPYNGLANCVPLDLSEKFETQPTVAQLEEAATSYMLSNQTHLPSNSIEIKFVQLQDSNEYAQFAPLLKCELCDSVNVIFPDYKTTGQFKIVKTVYNALLERYESLELGTLSTTLSEALGVSQSSGSSYSGGGGGGGGSGETYSLSISGHTITLSGDGGTTSSVTVPDNNTTYTLSISDHTLTLTPSTGSAQTVTVPDSNTTYSISISDHTITLTPSEGSAETITVPDDNTTYTLTRDGNNITLTPSSGTAQSIVATYYATCSTAAATSKKEVTVDSSFSLESGARIVVYMTNSNTVSNPTLSVNGGTAHAIRRYGTTAAGTSAAAGWNTGQMLSMTYSGSYWYIENWNNTTYSTITDAEYQAGTSTASRLVTPARLKNAILYHAPVTSVNGSTGAVTVQETLESGTNIKTINNQSILGSGNITISTGGSGADYIIEAGTSNGWLYRKWNSGLAELWCTVTITAQTNTSDAGGYVSASPATPQNFPFEFASVPYVQVTCDSDGVTGSVTSSVRPSTTSAGSWKLYRNSSNTNTSAKNFMFYVIGTEEQQTGITNLIPLSEEVSSTAIYNNGLGYKNGYYISSGNESANASDCMTGCIPYVINGSQPTDVIYISGYTAAADASHTRMCVRAALKTRVAEYNGFLNSNNIFDVEVLGTGYYKLTPKANVHSSFADVGWLQFSFHQPDASGIIITKNEPIE